MKKLTIACFVFLFGCATEPAPPSFSERMEMLEIGMSDPGIRERAGYPMSYQQHGDDETWVYEGDYKTCTIKLHKGFMNYGPDCKIDQVAKAIYLQQQALQQAIDNERDAQVGRNVAAAFQNQPPSYSAPSGSAVMNCGFPSPPTPGCKNSCQNGRWVQICD